MNKSQRKKIKRYLQFFPIFFIFKKNTVLEFKIAYSSNQKGCVFREWKILDLEDKYYTYNKVMLEVT